jgi:hypothetical protein
MRRVLGVLLTVAPFVAAAIAALGARRDMRMLWMAIAATLVARMTAAAIAPKHGDLTRTVSALAAATAAAAAVAVMFGAYGVFGVTAVAIVLSGCAALGAVLSRNRI